MALTLIAAEYQLNRRADPRLGREGFSVVSEAREVLSNPLLISVPGEEMPYFPLEFSLRH